MTPDEALVVLRTLVEASRHPEADAAFKILADEVERRGAIEAAAKAYVGVAISPLDDDAAEFAALCEILGED